MFAANQTRTLLGPADPARAAATAPPQPSAAELIARAAAVPESVVEARAAPDHPPGRRRTPSRRLVLAAAAVVAVATGAALLRPLVPSTVDGNGSGGGNSAARPLGIGPVLAPIAYQVDHNPPPAADRLRALAGRLTAAPYEDHTGRYAYHRLQEWGDPQMSDGPNHRYVLGFVHVEKTWQLSDGTGRQQSTPLPPEFPDRASRDYWTKRFPNGPSDGPTSFTLTPDSRPGPPPTDPAGLAERLEVRYGCLAAAKQVAAVYTRYALPTPTRAAILDVLAGMPGFRWRGEVTDRAGRRGVAITCDDPQHAEQGLLIFDGRTGVMLADELVSLRPVRMSAYLVLLDTDRMNRAG